MLLAYPNALILKVDESGINEVKYKETEHYTVTRSFLENPEKMLKELFLD